VFFPTLLPAFFAIKKTGPKNIRCDQRRVAIARFIAAPRMIEHLAARLRQEGKISGTEVMRLVGVSYDPPLPRGVSVVGISAITGCKPA
jgi:hypothetical protein